MKKLISFFTASALLVSSVAAFAAPNRFGIEKEREADVDLAIKLNSGSGTYKEYPSSDDPLVISVGNSSKTGTLNARAVLDMDAVAAEWNAYMNAALEEISGDDVRSVILDNTDLSASRFEITITADSNIKNSKGADVELNWNRKAQELFEQSGTTVYTEGSVTKYVIEMKIKADNETLDEYFTNSNREDLTLEIKGSSVLGVGEVYTVKGEIRGDVSIDIPGDANDMKVLFKGEDTAYVKQKIRSGSSGRPPVASQEPTEEPTETPTETPTEEPTETPTSIPTEKPAIQTQGTSNGAKLNYEDHFAYIIGYDEEVTSEDGTVTVKSVVRPENNITRAEVATIFYRLLDEESRDSFKTQFNTFSDVESGVWFNAAVSTVAAAGIVNGYDDGTFKPNNVITRAEFAAIAARFTSLVYDGEGLFTDISGHWAETAINNAAITGWVSGYDDGTFRPDNYITRAEAITLINNVLYRFIEEDGLHENVAKWEDNTPDKWYYTAVQEATNSHDYDREAIGETEEMTKINPNPDWESHEK